MIGLSCIRKPDEEEWTRGMTLACQRPGSVRLESLVSDYPLGVQYDPDEPSNTEEFTSMIGLVLLPKAQSLWDE